MKKIIVKGNYNYDGTSYDMISINDKMYLSTSECADCPEDAIYSRDIRNAFSILKFTEKLFKEVGLNFDDYFEVIDNVEREH